MDSLTYRQARVLVLTLGISILTAVTASAWLRGADPVEALAIALFIPILVALVFAGPAGGGVAGAAMSIIYVTIRVSTLEGLDIGEFLGSIIARVLLYLAFGILGGFANRHLEQSLKKLEIYDEVDDLTGVGNARSLISLADREAARARRYQTTFSLGILQMDTDVIAGLDRRRADKVIRKFYGEVDKAVRTTDKVTRMATPEVEELSVILPETGPEGARIFIERARQGLLTEIGEMGVTVTEDSITGRAMTLPGDEDELNAHIERVKQYEQKTHLAGT